MLYRNWPRLSGATHFCCSRAMATTAIITTTITIIIIIIITIITMVTMLRSGLRHQVQASSGPLGHFVHQPVDDGRSEAIGGG